MKIAINRITFGILIFCLMGFGSRCKNNVYHVRSTLVSSAPKKKLILGLIENRDIRTPRSVPKDFHDLLKFELIQRGYLLFGFSFNESIKQTDPKKSESSSLPTSLRLAAGENWNQGYVAERLLVSAEIKELGIKEGFDLFLQGTISVQSNDKILERKDYNYIFLSIYNAEGVMVGMLSSTFDNKTIYESELLKEVASAMALEFQTRIAPRTIQ